MPIDAIPYRETGYFSKLICDYLDESDQLKKFYNRYPSLDNFSGQLEEKQRNYSPENRKVLVNALQNQYEGTKQSELTAENIVSLSEETSFTITTGHQLNLFSGPLYFLFKIVSVINLCKGLSEKHPSYNFIPVFWMATEDHDFDEINFFRFRGKKIQWNRESGGAVGELDTSGLKEVRNDLETHFGESENATALLELFEDAYIKHHDLAAATRYLANKLFGEEGLVIIDGNDAALKKLFSPLAEAEVKAQRGFANINATTEQLEGLGYHKQVHPREVNLFYLQAGSRERILYQDDAFRINNNDRIYSEEEMLELLREHPERFSPNALLRPIYQEAILPNLCYIGGGGEISYWLQLKDYFDSSGITFPMIMLRNSAVLVPNKYMDKLSKLETEFIDLFLDTIELEKRHTEKISEVKIDFGEQKEHLSKQFSALYDLARKTDRSFEGAVAAQEKKQLNGLDKLEKRLLRAQRRKLRDELNRLTSIQEDLFPGGNLQERYCNFSEFYLDHGDQLINILLEKLDPFQKEFSIIRL